MSILSFAWLFRIKSLQLIVLLKPDSNCVNSFIFSRVNKVTTGT